MIDLLLDLDIQGGQVLARLTRTSGGAATPVATASAKTLHELTVSTAPLLASSAASQLEAAGARLFDLVLRPPLREFWLESYAQAEALELPIRLRVRTRDLPALTQAPWELLHDGRRALAFDLRSSVVRFIDELLPVRQFGVRPPLRALLTTASPAGYAEINVHGEEAMFRAAYRTWGKRALAPTVSHGVTLRQLGDLFRRARLAGQPFHLWHHCGHGGFASGDPEGFRLYLQPDGGEGYVSIDQLTTLLGAEADLRVAMLAVCSAGADQGLASALARLRLPAVVAFPTRIGHLASQHFSRVFHESLRVLPVEQAVSEARFALRAHRPDLPQAALPLLYSRCTGTSLLLQDPPAVVAGSQPAGSSVQMKVGRVTGDRVRVTGQEGESVGNGQVDMQIKDVDGKDVDVAGTRALTHLSASRVAQRESQLRHLSSQAALAADPEDPRDV